MLFLAACDAGGAGAPFTNSRMPPGLNARFWAPGNWGWGLIQPSGGPALRYGVGAPVGASRGDVIILPSHGESAEAWFETASDLIASGYTVWIMDGAGQGGSGRIAGMRDLGHVRDFESDILGLQALVKLVIRPADGTPPAILASGTAVLPALAAVERGLTLPLIASGPLEPDVIANSATSTLARLGFTTLRASGQKPWQRPDPKIATAVRIRAARSWAVANPDLRMGGVSWGWVGARRKLRAETLQPAALAKATSPVLLIADAPGALPCAQIPRCTEQRISASAPYAFTDNTVRQQWLSAIKQALASDHGS